jgi:hypothetical protein
VGIGIKGDCDVSVTQKFLHYFRMDLSGKHKGCAGMAEVVEANVWEMCPTEKRLEGPVNEVVTVQGSTNPCSEDQPVFLPKFVETLPLCDLKLAVTS